MTKQKTRREFLNDAGGFTAGTLLATHAVAGVHLEGSDTIQVARSQPSKPRETKRKNIRQYLSSIETTPESVQVAYRITPQGSVRLDEVLALLGLSATDLDGPIRRSHIQWHFI